LLALLNGVCRAGGAVASDTGMVEDLEIVATFKGLVAEEVDFVVVGRSEILQAVCFVPALREHIKGDLTTNRIFEIKVAILLLQSLHHVLANVVLLDISGDDAICAMSHGTTGNRLLDKRISPYHTPRRRCAPL
jgi:hypothetical protein